MYKSMVGTSVQFSSDDTVDLALPTSAGSNLGYVVEIHHMKY